MAQQTRVEMSFTLYDRTLRNPVDDYQGDTAPSKILVEQDIFITALYDQLKEQEINVTSVNGGKCECKELVGATFYNIVLSVLICEKPLPSRIIYSIVAPGQLVVALGYQGPVKLADQIVATQETITEVARSSGCAAGFQRNETLLFVSFSDLVGEDELHKGLSVSGSHFLAGILQRIHPLSIISRGPVKEERRLMGWNSRRLDSAVRVRQDPLSQATGIQYDLCDSSFNPYISLAAILACGIYGIQNEVHLNSEQDEEEALLSDQVVISTTCLASDDFLMTIMGPAISKTHLAFRKQETKQSEEAVV
jgi:hypothetical protein